MDKKRFRRKERMGEGTPECLPWQVTVMERIRIIGHHYRVDRGKRIHKDKNKKKYDV